MQVNLQLHLLPQQQHAHTNTCGYIMPRESTQYSQIIMKINTKISDINPWNTPLYFIII